MQVIQVNTFEFQFLHNNGSVLRTFTIISNGVKYLFKLTSPKTITDGTIFNLNSLDYKIYFVPDSGANLSSIQKISTLICKGQFILGLNGFYVPVNLLYSCDYPDNLSSEFGCFTNIDIQLAIES